MLSRIYTAGLIGIDGYGVTVECDFQDKLPCFGIVGLPDNAVKEAKDRIRAAFVNSGFPFPDSQITVNLAPADKRKEGSGFDLAMLIAIMQCAGVINENAETENRCFIGELSLSGEVRPVNGMLSMCLAAKEAGKQSFSWRPKCRGGFGRRGCYSLSREKSRRARRHAQWGNADRAFSRGRCRRIGTPYTDA